MQKLCKEYIRENEKCITNINVIGTSIVYFIDKN